VSSIARNRVALVTGAEIHPAPVDLSDLDQIASTVADVKAAFGPDRTAFMT